MTWTYKYLLYLYGILLFVVSFTYFFLLNKQMNKSFLNANIIHYIILETQCTKLVQGAQPWQLRLPQLALTAPHSPSFIQKVAQMVVWNVVQTVALLFCLINILALYYIGCFSLAHISLRGTMVPLLPHIESVY